jgi:Na+/H+-translocating membrane pyrophosphatase
MGSDLFGSFAESSCAALVICSQLPTFYNNSSYILYPVMIMAISIPFCMICSVLVVFAAKAEDYDALSNALKV